MPNAGYCPNLVLGFWPSCVDSAIVRMVYNVVTEARSRHLDARLRCLLSPFKTFQSNATLYAEDVEE